MRSITSSWRSILVSDRSLLPPQLCDSYLLVGILNNPPLCSGWDGKVSLFAHSLGSLISYDLLTHSPGEIGHNGIRFPGLEFEVDIFFGVGYVFVSHSLSSRCYSSN